MNFDPVCLGFAEAEQLEKYQRVWQLHPRTEVLVLEWER